MSGYVPCACRDCFETAIGEPGALCHSCKEAGCTPCTCVDHDHPNDRCPAVSRGHHEECQAPGAYGGDEEEP